MLPVQRWGAGTGSPELQRVSHRLLVVTQGEQRKQCSAWKGQGLCGRQPAGRAVPSPAGSVRHRASIRSGCTAPGGSASHPGTALRCVCQRRPGQLRTACPRRPPHPAPRSTTEALPPRRFSQPVLSLPSAEQAGMNK